MQPGMDGFMGPYANAIPSMPYNMGYGMGPLDMPFGVMPPHDPFATQAYVNMMLPVPPQRFVHVRLVVDFYCVLR